MNSPTLMSDMLQLRRGRLYLVDYLRETWSLCNGQTTVVQDMIVAAATGESTVGWAQLVVASAMWEGV